VRSASGSGSDGVCYGASALHSEQRQHEIASQHNAIVPKCLVTIQSNFATALLCQTRSGFDADAMTQSCDVRRVFWNMHDEAAALQHQDKACI